MKLQQKDKNNQAKNQGREQLNAMIGQHVIHVLGQPENLQRVQVRPLWPDHYRVNVFTGLDAASVKVAHSFFLVTDEAGNINTCVPTLKKQYEKDRGCATP